METIKKVRAASTSPGGKRRLTSKSFGKRMLSEILTTSGFSNVTAASFVTENAPPLNLALLPSNFTPFSKLTATGEREREKQMRDKRANKCKNAVGGAVGYTHELISYGWS